eukprot:TRINITY_DN15783_c0_g1_i1.p1 TRINITY_DN15783_c0_g1~~TRINITY_DN15783_c0_g1_i1.p1  ORF type:complete len:547 (+),score=41.20 TRINITY_DN15783_c0_g1_i1:73-1713(+)
MTDFNTLMKSRRSGELCVKGTFIDIVGSSSSPRALSEPGSVSTACSRVFFDFECRYVEELSSALSTPIGARMSANGGFERDASFSVVEAANSFAASSDAQGNSPWPQESRNDPWRPSQAADDDQNKSPEHTLLEVPGTPDALLGGTSGHSVAPVLQNTQATYVNSWHNPQCGWSANHYNSSNVAQGGCREHFFLNENRCYDFVSELGQGTHCVVYRCQRRNIRANYDGECSYNEFLALKTPRHAKVDMIHEISAMRALKANGGEAVSRFFLELLGTACVPGRGLCIAMPLCGPDLRTLCRKRACRPFSSQFVLGVAEQLLQALGCLAKAQMFHADIKPENIALRESFYSNFDCDNFEPPVHANVVILDMGNSFDMNRLTRLDHVLSYVASRWYRAPEIIIGAPASFGIDAWSVGLVLAEMAVGATLFPGPCEATQVRLITELIGMPSVSTLQDGSRSSKFFTMEQRMDGIGLRLNSYGSHPVKPPPSHPEGVLVLNLLRGGYQVPSIRPELADVVDLLRGLLVFDPRIRRSAYVALTRMRCRKSLA